MEARKILFVMNSSSSQKSIMSEATTLGALKADMRAAGINYDNMTFFEGRTRTELKDDASVLPTNVPVAAKGTTPASTTNDLVFMLTTANKKIKSGAVDSKDRRPIAYAQIKQLGLQDACKAKYGKNFTQCSTPDLEALIASNSSNETKVESKVAPKAKVVEEDNTPTPVVGNTTVIITNTGAAKLQVVKVVKETLGLGLKEATDVVDGVPSRINGLTKEMAAKFVSDLIGVGATATIEQEQSVQNNVPAICVDIKARTILKRLLQALMADDYEEYEVILNELESDEELSNSYDQSETESKKEKEEKLSRDEVDAMFGGWAR